MKKIVFSILLLSRAVPCFSQNLAWIHNILDSSYSMPGAIQGSGNGNIYMAANQYGVLGDTNANYRIEKLIAFNSSGAVIWEKTDTVNGWRALESIAVSDSAVFVCDDSLVKSYSHSGILKWAVSVKGAALLYANNGLYVADMSHLKKYDDNGALLWTKPITQWNPVKLAKGDANNIILWTTDSWVMNNPKQLEKYDQNGNLIWSMNLFQGPVYQVSTDPSGNIYANDFISIKKLDPNGILAWTQASETTSSNFYSSAGELHVSQRRYDTLFDCIRDPADGHHISRTPLTTTVQRIISQYTEQNGCLYVTGTFGNWFPPQAYAAKLSCNVISGLNNKKQDLSAVQVFPNPNNGKFNASAAPHAIYDIYGAAINYRFNTSINEIELSDQKKGLYFIQFKTGEATTVKKVIVE